MRLHEGEEPRGSEWGGYEGVRVGVSASPDAPGCPPSVRRRGHEVFAPTLLRTHALHFLACVPERVSGEHVMGDGAFVLERRAAV